MAAPIVAGEAALVRAAFPSLSNIQIIDHILKHSVKIQGPNPNARIDAGAALTTTPAAQLTNTVQLSASSQTITESTTSVVVTISRSGDTSAAATVDYTTGDFAGANDCSTINGFASSRCDYEATMGTLHFAAGEGAKTISIPIVDDSFVEGNETFTLSLSNATATNLGSPSTITVIINDNETTANGSNPIDQAQAFVREHYIDFLNREPDGTGLSFWTNEITQCGTDAQCIEVKRINVSAAFFVSIEFQETGYLVYRTYKAAYGNLPGAPIPVRLSEFLPDTQQIGRGVVVGTGTWQQQLDDNKQAFFADFVSRDRFISAYPQTMPPAQFVDALNVNADAALSLADRDTLVADLTSGKQTRAQVLRAVAEDADLARNESNKAFVLMQYFGYLRRNPNDAPEATLDFQGYNFWLSKLNQFGGNFINAEMVKAFLVSGEYRHRFGP